MKGYSIFIWVIICFTATSIYGQNRQDLENERMRVIELIEYTDSLVNNQEEDRIKSVEVLSALRAQIDQRNDLLDNTKQRIQIAELEIEDNQRSLEVLNNRLSNIEKQYKQVLRSKYLRKMTGSKWVTILSASSINDAFLRWNYYRQFDSYRLSKVDEIAKLKASVADKNEEIKSFALKNSELILEQERQNSELQSRISQQNQLVIDLQKDKSILEVQLNAIRKNREQLNVAIERKVLGKLRGNRDQIESVSTTNKNYKLTKGTLSLPVTNGFIIDESIGRYKDNLRGISIQVANNAKVIAISDGVVISSGTMDGYGKMIILQHGSYYSIYANLGNIQVSEGDEVTIDQILGTVSSSVKRLHFELWKGKYKLDAAAWLQN